MMEQSPAHEPALNDLFVVISAVGVNYGVFSYAERISQLKETIQSIKKHKPNAYICLVEVSDTPITIPDAQYFQALVDKMFILHEHKFIREILIKLDDKDTNRTARKTIGELVGMLEFMGWLRQQPMKFNRIYKIAGRLKLNEHFANTKYQDFENHVVVKKRKWYDDFVYLIQLWSFDYKQLDTLFEIFLEIWDNELDTLYNHAFLSLVEPALYKYLTKYKIPVIELEGNLGVEGYHGQDGAIVYN